MKKLIFTILPFSAVLLGALLVSSIPTGFHDLRFMPAVHAQSGTFQACYVQGGTGTLNTTGNHANCRNFSSFFGGLRAISTAATVAYVELYNQSTDVGATPSATNFVECIPIPASTTGAGIVDIVETAGGNSGVLYNNGISYIINGSCSTSVASAPPAGIYITIFLR